MVRANEYGENGSASEVGAVWGQLAIAPDSVLNNGAAAYPNNDGATKYLDSCPLTLEDKKAGTEKPVTSDFGAPSRPGADDRAGSVTPTITDSGVRTVPASAGKAPEHQLAMADERFAASEPPARTDVHDLRDLTDQNAGSNAGQQLNASFKGGPHGFFRGTVRADEFLPGTDGAESFLRGTGCNTDLTIHKPSPGWERIDTAANKFMRSEGQEERDAALKDLQKEVKAGNSSALFVLQRLSLADAAIRLDQSIWKLRDAPADPAALKDRQGALRDLAGLELSAHGDKRFLDAVAKAKIIPADEIEKARAEARHSRLHTGIAR